MKLSTRARYGLKALIDLGLHCETEAVSIQSIASRQNISDSYLEQLMAKLKKAGLVESTRGAGGGYRGDPHRARPDCGRGAGACRGSGLACRSDRLVRWLRRPGRLRRLGPADRQAAIDLRERAKELHIL